MLKLLNAVGLWISFWGTRVESFCDFPDDATSCTFSSALPRFLSESESGWRYLRNGAFVKWQYHHIFPENKVRPSKLLGECKSTQSKGIQLFTNLPGWFLIKKKKRHGAVMYYSSRNKCQASSKLIFITCLNEQKHARLRNRRTHPSGWHCRYA